MRKDINYNNITLTVTDGRVFVTRLDRVLELTEKAICNGVFCEVQLSGEPKYTHAGVKMTRSSEGARLMYVSHSVKDGVLTVVQRSELVETATHFTFYNDTNAIRICTDVKNISSGDIVLDEVSSCCFYGLGHVSDAKNIMLYRFYQGHHTECQPVRISLFDSGIIRKTGFGQKRVYGLNVGSWSTKEELPQIILEKDSRFMMMQIESNSSWYWEISDNNELLYLYAGGPNATFGDWQKRLAPGQSYTTVNTALAFGSDLNSVIGNMTLYRRHIAGKCASDEELPTVFNEYMHLSWDSPSQEKTAQYAPVIAEMGVDYYVVDCGWHDEVPGDIVYPYVGEWMESKVRFPDGLKTTSDRLKSLGLKPGFWIEPEIVGMRCEKSIEYYGDECFLRRNGKKICIHGRYFLDFTKQKVVDRLTATITRMVDDYGADYIKLDYNQDVGIGCENTGISYGEGLENNANAYLDWVDGVRQKFPNVVFETCSSGGMRMDYKTLSHFSLISTSDQIDYKKYPYIVGNILSAVIPEQAAVWSYPVDSVCDASLPETCPPEYVNSVITDEQIIMNMVNSFLGRVHLAGHVDLLNDDKRALIKEGIELYRKLIPVKKHALPYFPIGFTGFDREYVASGLRTEDKLYLAIWNILGVATRSIPLGFKARSVTAVYPHKNGLKYLLKNDTLSVEFTEQAQARFFEISLDLRQK